MAENKNIEFCDLSALDSLVFIGIQAFANCSNLTFKSLPKKIEEIGTSAFAYCTSINFSALPDTLETLGPNAFRSCESLGEITINNT
jgi:hypothetical protein